VTSGITIRDYRDGDAEAVIAIAKDLQAHELTIYDRLKPVDAIDHTYIAALWKDIEKYQGCFLVAEHEGAVSGYVTLLTHCDSSDDTDEVFYRYSHIGDLAVIAGKRSLGIGKALIADCERVAKTAGVKWLRLGVLADNVRARTFYQREGFSDQLIKMEKPL
jgi:ribosomal protein S18 acetylase RimI-like enzyme